MKNLFVGVITFIITVFILSDVAVGLTLEEQRRIEEEKRRMLEKAEFDILACEKRLVFDFGGWVNYRYDNYNDDDNDSSTKDTLDDIHTADLRFWIKVALRPPVWSSAANEHSFYIRWKDIHKHENRPSGIDRGYDHDGPNLDYAYFSLDFRPLWLELGRRYFSVGQGIAYSNVNDGAELLLSFENFSVKGFISHTLPDEENIDTSIPGWDKESDRTYYGIEGTYLGIPGHGIYSYILLQRNETDEEPEDVAHDYDYDSEYLGLGLQGKITPQMHYWAEIIKENGKSYIYNTSEEEDVDAWGGDFGVTYDLDVYSHPNFTLEYAFGSGDSERTSVTDTQGGNAAGDDDNFLYFGYLPAGYALSPRLSNIHFYKAGILFKPLEKYHLFRNISVGIDYYRYYKYKKAGGIYDSEASISDNDIGREIDLNISWEILSDLSWSLEYGHFKPGDAYPDSANDSEEYFSTGLTFMF